MLVRRIADLNDAHHSPVKCCSHPRTTGTSTRRPRQPWSGP